MVQHKKNRLSGREPALIALLDRKNKRRLSLRRIGTMLNMLPPSAVSLEAVREMLYSNTVEVRYKATHLLAKRADREARIIIEEALHTGEFRTRASVARVLNAFSWYSAEPMIQVALADDDPRVRESAVYALCSMRHGNAYQCLVTALDDEEDLVLEAAAYALRANQDTAVVPVLQQVLKAKNPEIRVRALEALGSGAYETAIPIVRSALSDPDPDVNYAAVLSLLELTRGEFLSELAQIIMTTAGKVREKILMAFFHATSYLKIDVSNSDSAEAMFVALEHALQDDYPPVRQAVIWSLAWLRHPRTTALIAEAYDTESDSAVKAHIVRVAVNLMIEDSETLLQSALQSDDPLINAEAQRIVAERERTGIIATYDDNADEGRVMNRALLLGHYDERL